MTELLEALQGASAPDRETYRPEFFRLPVDRDRVEALLKREPRVVVHDTLHGQLTELVRSLNPSVKFSREALDEAARAHLKGTPAAEYGVWVYYPWNFRLVHLLDEAEFSLVRTDRNRNKITREEQAVLATKKVGVIGLSVGQSVSLTMALERSFGEIRLADFDTLELSNLNRIRSGVHEMGVPKVINTAREIAELDPFLKVTVFPEGITRDNMDVFFSVGGPLDVLIEECDSVDIKILARQKAKGLGIPVVMDMSDRGCLDVERFDLEPDRPIMHGWIDHLDLDAAGRAMTNEEKIPYMLPIVGTETLSPRMKASMVEMGQTVGTWPQLATSVVLGGALTGDTTRRIFLDHFSTSGRWHVDLEEQISDKKPPLVETHATDLGEAAESKMPRIPAGCTGVDHGGISKEEALELAEAGALAPSVGNMQAWSFVHHMAGLTLMEDQERAKSRWDPDHLMSNIGLGACLENMLLKAASKGIAIHWKELHSTNGHPTEILLRAAGGPGQALPDDVTRQLEPFIPIRATNRQVVERQLLDKAVIQRLADVTSTIQGCALHTFEASAELDELALICAGAERLRLLDRMGHEEFFTKEIRWSPEEAKRTMDGLDVATLELQPSDLAALRIVSDPHAMDLVRSWGGGKGLERFSAKGIRSAAAVVLISVDDDSLRSRIMGGRAMQRVWLQATREGLAFHPISAPIFVHHAMRHLRDVNASHILEMDQLWSRFISLTKLHDRRPLFMFRATLAGEPKVRSLRRPLSEMFRSSILSSV